MKVHYLEKQANRVGKDGLSGVVVQTNAIKLAMAVTQEWWSRFPPSSVYRFSIYYVVRTYWVLEN